MEPSYKQHGAVDDICGVIVDVEVTTGQASEGSQLPEQIERIEENTGKKIKTLAADAGYAHGKNYQHLEEKNLRVNHIWPKQHEQKTKYYKQGLFQQPPGAFSSLDRAQKVLRKKRGN